MLAAVLLEQIITEVRRPVQTLFAANGAFDLLHLGLEVKYLFHGCCQEGDYMIFKINASASDAALKVSSDLVHLQAKLIELLSDF